MYFISGGIGFIASVIFIILIIVFSLRGKPCKTPLIALFLSVLLFLGSGFLYSRTDPSIGGAGFLRYVLRDRTVPPDLWGEWRDTNGDEDSFHGIFISGDTIEVYWVTDGGNSTSLYWAGTFEAPPDGKEPYSWESVCDEERTAAAQLAANERTKVFTYSNGILSYEADMMGVNTTVETRKQPWFPTEEDEEGEEGGDTAGEPAGAAPAQISASGTLGDYSVAVKGAELTTNSSGDDIIVVTYTWTNNSASVTSALTNMMEKAYQNGTPLDIVTIPGEDEAQIFDGATRTQEVQPGESVDVECAFVLRGKKTNVEFEVSELLSASGDTVVMEFTPSDLAVREPAEAPEKAEE